MKAWEQTHSIADPHIINNPPYSKENRFPRAFLPVQIVSGRG